MANILKDFDQKLQSDFKGVAIGFLHFTKNSDSEFFVQLDDNGVQGEWEGGIILYEKHRD
jgi:hypothetical protein